MTKEECCRYVDVLREELIPAMGCTEPIAIAYAVAKARDVLDSKPLSAVLEVSGNIIKNAKSVTVPHTGGMKGIRAAFAAGLVAGDSSKELEVIASVDDSQLPEIADVRDNFPLEISVPKDAHIFDIAVTLKSDKHTSYIRIIDNHTNIVCIRRDDEYLLRRDIAPSAVVNEKRLTVQSIVEFAETVDTSAVEPILSRQIAYNMAIAQEGMDGNYGANVGKVLLGSFASDIKIKAKAYAAAGSDARMNGCELPVVINSGSGNQGITASVPVVVYAREMGADDQKLLRALCISNLITIHLKSGIGTLSAYCGAVSAGVGAACGIAYLTGGGYDDIAHTIVNALAIDSGIICDGAKASCAAKIAMSVESGLLGLAMYRSGNQFVGGDGIVKCGVENTIRSVSRLARDGMCETDKEIINIMLDE